MFNIVEKEINWGGRNLKITTGKIARQALASVVVTYGETQVLATICANKTLNKDIDFFPLSVHYQEKYYAVGKFPGGFFKRESKPSEKEILISRLIDRPIRPTFDDKFKNEVQVLVTVLSYDGENTTDITAMIASFVALALSGLPTSDIVGAAKVGLINGSFVLNPKYAENAKSDLELIVAGTKDGILMVESEAQEIQEETMLDALSFAQDSFQPIINLIKELQQIVAKPKWTLEAVSLEETVLIKKVEELAKTELVQAFEDINKQSRTDKIVLIKNNIIEKLKAENITEDLLKVAFPKIFKDLEKNIVRGNILNLQKRIDRRKLDEIRPILAEIDVVPRVHGSALFTRGETQALVITTLGTEDDEQIVDDIEGNSRERFTLHYNFPPYSVGECGRAGAPGRREIGHGKLAYRALNPLMPKKNQCPYSIRVVSEITESNGSSSMATVCGASLSMMVAGIPFTKPVAGIAMGLIKENDKYAVLSDILGDEDFLGDMDFKVAGTDVGITSLQMDIKITSITKEIMKQALEQAKSGRVHILNEMAKAISTPRSDVNKYAPKIRMLQISKEKIKDVIGTGGKVIKEICESAKVKIDISNDGMVRIFGFDEEGINKAKEKILFVGASPELNKVYTGKVVKLLESAAFVRFLGSTDGFLHISEIADKRDSKINDFLKVDDIIKVKVIEIGDKGRIRLSVKGVN